MAIKYQAVQACVCCLRVRVLDIYTYLWQPFKEKNQYDPASIKDVELTTCPDCKIRYGEHSVRKASAI